jgi:hypothetical protein
VRKVLNATAFELISLFNEMCSHQAWDSTRLAVNFILKVKNK